MSNIFNTIQRIVGHPVVREQNRKICQAFHFQQIKGISSAPIDSDQDTEPYIPPYQQKEGETIEILRARLLYQSRKRGMLENGLLLSTFASKNLTSMTAPELKDYDRLINLPSNDWDIYYWATGVKPIPAEFDNAVMKKFIEHVRNNKKESRFQQPDLY